jgi:HrpA-like RNA helicase
VIDTGKAKKMRYSHLLRCMTLREEDVAQASTKQRRGRAGRTDTGYVYYLFSKKDHCRMEEVGQIIVNEVILLYCALISSFNEV